MKPSQQAIEQAHLTANLILTFSAVF